MIKICKNNLKSAYLKSFLDSLLKVWYKATDSLVINEKMWIILSYGLLAGNQKLKISIKLSTNNKVFYKTWVFIKHL